LVAHSVALPMPQEALLVALPTQHEDWEQT
jgi:hypothetical protein